MGNKVTTDVPQHRHTADAPAVLTQDNIRPRGIELRSLFVTRGLLRYMTSCSVSGNVIKQNPKKASPSTSIQTKTHKYTPFSAKVATVFSPGDVMEKD